MLKFSTVKLLVGTSLLITAAQGMAQWQWRDNNGRNVFSDRPPPANIPRRNIIKQPGVAAPVAISTSNTTTRDLPKPDKSAKPKKPETKQATDNKKKTAEETKKAKAEAEQVKKAKAENCRNARSSLATLNNNPHIATVDEKGKRTVMDDAAKKKERERLKKLISSNCK